MLINISVVSQNQKESLCIENTPLASPLKRLLLFSNRRRPLYFKTEKLLIIVMELICSLSGPTLRQVLFRHDAMVWRDGHT